MRLLVARALLLVTLAWTGFWAVSEAHRLARDFSAGRFARATPSAWRLGSMPPAPGGGPAQPAQVAELRRFLAEVEPHLPPGAVVAISSPKQRRQDDDFFRMLWAAYYLPAQNLRRAPRRPEAREADYWLTFGSKPEGPGLRIVYASEAGALVRIGP